jgi:NADH:ubiquinone oxidoreductase subunit F (NADH-binding)
MTPVLRRQGPDTGNDVQSEAALVAPRGLPRLLAGLIGSVDRFASVDTLRRPSAASMTLSFDQHRQLHGRLPRRDPDELIQMIEDSGLRGCGGARFPTGVKLRAVRNGRRLAKRPSAVVVNGSETEPRSGKDRVLLASSPHLVLDGAILAARAVGAEEVIVKVDDHGDSVIGPLGEAIAARTTDRLPISLSVSHLSYVSGEESAVINFLGGGAPIPTFGQARPFERGYRKRPTLIQNVETLAHLALIARHGPAWFRELGTQEDPGSTLVTISGDVASPGVYEVELGTPIREILEFAGGPTERLQALLLGGYFGKWCDAATDTLDTPLASGPLRQRGLALGSGVIVALGASADGLAEGAAIATYLARESSGQCGPCVHGLAAIAQSLTRVADGTAARGEQERLLRWCDDVDGRGACHHPSGAVRFVRSTLETFV